MSANPILQDKHLQQAQAPATPGARFTMDGAITKTLALLGVLVVAGYFGWNTVEASPEFGVAELPGWVLPAIVAGFVILILAWWKPGLAMYLAPAYAIIEGFVVGAISHATEIAFDGIVLQAVIGTVGVFATMLLLYTSRTIRVTPKLRVGVMIATGGIMLIYLFQIAMSLIGSDLQVPYLHDSGPIGILISLVIVGVAAFNFLLDFDFIEKAEQSGAPAQLEWVAALGLLVTLVWLYLEILRLLSKLRD